jgi:phage shock protein E
MLIDVRTKGEYDQGHIEGAVLHDITDMLRGGFPNVPKDGAIIVYCQSGYRSLLAKSLMEKAGFTNVTDGGGMDELTSKPQ